MDQWTPPGYPQQSWETPFEGKSREAYTAVDYYREGMYTRASQER